MNVLAALITVCILCPASARTEHGIASVYNEPGCLAQQKPRGGCERFSPHTLTAAHKSLPFGTIVKVTNLRNGRTVLVRINDRGPYVRHRIIDLTPAAARVLGFSERGAGLARVTVEVQPKAP